MYRPILDRCEADNQEIAQIDRADSVYLTQMRYLVINANLNGFLRTFGERYKILFFGYSIEKE